ncbi:hypothetical protein FZ103_10645 [Streptomonospora sp. PA3]|uniref:hypothetical protein n=1 Tax=Streptomonospora sp. PA3 TaxID=2607326 RepID=UPI0012DD8812|nr:hypothetical protein [Streptomonospora sp. PA3]MUL41629.1 hypothetical protein [Streptomonospora sp. PA3]
MATEAELRRIRRAGRTLDYALTAVAAGALAFSTVNVALLAIAHGVPAWIAWLLEPLVGVALWAVLSSDAVLSRYGRSAGGWAWGLRTFAGVATLTLNIWSSVFAGTGRHLALSPDPAGILLHAIAPILLILLAEAAPRYRAAFAAITADLTAQTASPTPQPPSTVGDECFQDDRHPRPESPTAPVQEGSARPGATADADPAAHDSPHDGAAARRLTQPRTAATLAPAFGLNPPPPEPATAAKSRRRRRERTDARARSILLLEPDITGAELARRLGVAPRSGQRILERITTEEPKEKGTHP